MKIANYDRGLVEKNIASLRNNIKTENSKKNRTQTLLKSIICIVLVFAAMVGFVHATTYDNPPIPYFVSIGILIVIAAFLSALLFSIAIANPSEEGWTKRKTFEMLYYDVDTNGTITNVEKHPSNKSVVVTYLDKNQYVQSEEIHLIDIIYTPNVDEETLDVSHGILFRHYPKDSKVEYTTLKT